MFQHYLPVNLIFGRGEVKRIGEIAGKYGKKAFLVTGKSSTKRTGILDLVCDFLQAEGIEAVIFNEVEPNPLTTTVMAGTKKCRDAGCDLVIALGGGSVIDCAKAIAFMTKNEGDINDYIFMKKSSDKASPLVLVPTTCGTGSEGNSFAVLTNPETGDKKSLRSLAIVAKASIVDSCLCETMPKTILASVGFDALCHAMEAYLSKIAQPFSTMMAKEAMQLIGNHLLAVYAGDGTAADWDAVALASTLGGMAIGLAGVTLPHAMEHPASGLRDIVHGRGLAALTPAITKASVAKAGDGGAAKMVLEKYAVISQALGGVDAYDCEERIRCFLGKLDLETNFTELGMEKADVEWMSSNCMKVSAAGVENHPVTFSQEEILGLYNSVY